MVSQNAARRSRTYTLKEAGQELGLREWVDAGALIGWRRVAVPEWTFCRIPGRTTAAALPRSPAGRGVSTQGGPRVWSLLRE